MMLLISSKYQKQLYLKSQLLNISLSLQSNKFQHQLVQDMQADKYRICKILPPAPKTARGQPAFLDANQNYLAYFNGCIVVLRPINKQLELLTVLHSSDVLAAKFSPDGKLIASIDSKGNLFINEICPNKLILTKSFQGFYTSAKSIDWSADGKRLCVVGSSKNPFGRVVSIDTGSNVGQISAVQAPLNSISFHSKKNNRIVAGGDQFGIKVYEGPPYKFIKSAKTHSGYINQIKYSPSGTHFVTAGADRRIVLYDGETCQKIVEKENAHQGGVTGIDWIDEESFVSVSSDKMLNIWNLKLQRCQSVCSGTEAEMKNKKNFNRALFGVRVQKDKVYCVSLNGDIVVFQFSNPRQIDENGAVEILTGHRGKPIEVIEIQKQRYIILDNYGRILFIETNGVVKTIQGEREIKLILGGCFDGTFLYILLGDNTVLKYDVSSFELKSQFKVQGAKFIGSSQKGYVCCLNNKLQKYQDEKVLFKASIPEESSTFKVNKNLIAVGSQKGSIYLFNNSLQQLLQFQNTPNRVSALSIHQSYVFAGDSTGKSMVWQFKEGKITRISETLGNHTSVITSISLNNNLIYTFSLDGKFNVWNFDNFKRQDTVDVDRSGILYGLSSGNKIVTCAADQLVRLYKINH